MVKLIYGIYKKTNTVYNTFINKLSLKINNVQYGKNLIIDGVAFIRNRGVIEIHNDVKINSSYKSNPIGGNCFMSIVTDSKGKVIIKDNVGISNTAIYSKIGISIGSNTMIGGDCKIYDNDFHSLDIYNRLYGSDSPICAKVSIEDGVFIGGGSTILKGVTIGRNSIVGAGSVVSKSIPPMQLWAGNPAKYIRDIQ